MDFDSDKDSLDGKAFDFLGFPGLSDSTELRKIIFFIFSRFCEFEISAILKIRLILDFSNFDKSFL